MAGAAVDLGEVGLLMVVNVLEVNEATRLDEDSGDDSGDELEDVVRVLVVVVVIGEIDRCCLPRRTRGRRGCATRLPVRLPVRLSSPLTAWSASGVVRSGGMGDC